MGFDTDSHALVFRHSVLGICPVLPEPARRDSANLSPKGSPHVMSEARDNKAGLVLANGPAVAGSANQFAEGDIRRALIN